METERLASGHTLVLFGENLPENVVMIFISVILVKPKSDNNIHYSHPAKASPVFDSSCVASCLYGLS